jgi:hypothetical protein
MGPLADLRYQSGIVGRSVCPMSARSTALGRCPARRRRRPRCRRPQTIRRLQRRIRTSHHGDARRPAVSLRQARNSSRAAIPLPARSSFASLVPAFPIRRMAVLGVVVDGEEDDARDDSRSEPPTGIEHDHGGGRDEDDGAPHRAVPAAAGDGLLVPPTATMWCSRGITTPARPARRPRA